MVGQKHESGHNRAAPSSIRTGNAIRHICRSGKENNNDSPSSGERTGISPNQCCYGNIGVVGPRCRKTFSEKNSLENETIDGDSPVFEAERSVVVS